MSYYDAMRAKVSGDVVNLVAGVTVQISGSNVNVSGDIVYFINDGVNNIVKISGQTIQGSFSTNVSGNTVYLVNDGTNNVVRISGQTISVAGGVNTSGNTVYLVNDSLNNIVKTSGQVSYEYGTTPKAGAGVVITASSGGTQLPNVSGFSFLIRNISGNGTMMVAGTSTPPDVIGISGIGVPLYGADSLTLKLDNLNRVRALAGVSGQVLSYLAVDR